MIKEEKGLTFNYNELTGKYTFGPNSFFSKISVDGVQFSIDERDVNKNGDYIIPKGVRKLYTWGEWCPNVVKNIYLPASFAQNIEANFEDEQKFFLPLRTYKYFQNIFVDKKNPKLCDVDGILYSHDMKKLICIPTNKKIDEYILPATIEEIKEFALQNTSITTLVIPSNFTGTLNFKHLQHLFNLKEIVVDKNNNKYCSMDGVLYSKDMTELIFYPNKKTDQVFKCPETVQSINNPFDINNNLKEVIFPNNVSFVKFQYINQPFNITLHGKTMDFKTFCETYLNKLNFGTDFSVKRISSNHLTKTTTTTKASQDPIIIK